jgi:hypothetical protein
MYISKEVGCGTFKFPIPRYPVTVKGKILSITITGLALKFLGVGMGRSMEKLPSSQETLVYGGSVWSRSFLLHASRKGL